MARHPHVMLIFTEGSESGATDLAPETAFTFVLQPVHLQRVSPRKLFPAAVTLEWLYTYREKKKNTKKNYSILYQKTGHNYQILKSNETERNVARMCLCFSRLCAN